jgi:hypothetical protein
VTAPDFEAARDAVPSLTAPLRPVIAQSDRLSRYWCYMMILVGPVKVDLIFNRPHPIAAPWQVSAARLAAIDDHFWDWALWLGSKQLAGQDDVVTAELRKMHAHLLAPLGVTITPSTLDRAIAKYRAARDFTQRRHAGTKYRGLRKQPCCRACVG